MLDVLFQVTEVKAYWIGALKTKISPKPCKTINFNPPKRRDVSISSQLHRRDRRPNETAVIKKKIPIMRFPPKVPLAELIEGCRKVATKSAIAKVVIFNPSKYSPYFVCIFITKLFQTVVSISNDDDDEEEDLDRFFQLESTGIEAEAGCSLNVMKVCAESTQIEAGAECSNAMEVRTYLLR